MKYSDRDSIIIEAMPYIKKTAGYFAYKVSSIDAEDLTSFIVIKALEAAQTYNPKGAASLRTWMIGKIKYYCADYCRSVDPLSRHYRDVINEIKKLDDGLTSKQKADKLCVSVKLIDRAEMALSSSSTINLSEIDTDCIESASYNEDFGIQFDIEKMLLAVQQLPEREQMIIDGFLKGENQCRYMKELGITESRCSQLMVMGKKIISETLMVSNID